MFKIFLMLILWTLKNDRGETGELDPATLEWPADLDETLKGNPTLMKYADKDTKKFKIGEVFKALTHATSALGKDKIVKPSDAFSDSQWEEWFTAAGVPKEEDKYTIQNKVPEGLKPDENFFKEFKKFAMQNNLFPKQAQAMVDFYNNKILEQTKAAENEFKTSLNANVATLKGEWGSAYDHNLKQTKAVMAEFTTPEELKQMEDSGVFYEPTIIKMFHKISQKYLEDGGPKNLPADLMGMDALQTQIKAIMAEKGYHNKAHPEHKYYMDKMLKLQGAKVALSKSQNGAHI